MDLEKDSTIRLHFIRKEGVNSKIACDEIQMF